MKLPILLTAPVLVTAIPLVPPPGPNAVPLRSETVLETAKAAGTFRTLLAAVEAAGLTQALEGKGPFTVFAPTDEAFSKLPKGTVASLLEPANRAKLTAILTYHVVPRSVPSKEVVKLKWAETLQGQRLQVTVSEGSVKVSGAGVVRTDIECSNGLIHVVDEVLLPSTDDLVKTASKAGSFTTLLTAARAAGLAATLADGGPFTVFAPTDEAFAKLPKGTVESLLEPANKEKLAAILKFHVVAGRVYSDATVKLGKADTLLGKPVQIEVREGKATVNGAALVATDIEALNGVVHVIDTVLLPKD